ncbi:MAG: adenylate/guanylate cyclase domain-containing protein [Acidobacteria bacterium]|nr:adenylate/guanylate cyclase domain-containing protein [Acidobacteriota bacterium]
MPSTSKHSFIPRLLRRWYWALAALLTAAVWAAVSLAMLPREDRAGSYSSRPYGYTTGLEDSALDLLFQLRDARHKETRARGLSEPITLVEVDEESIRASNVRLQRWPRDWYAQLIDRASAAGANTIGLDVYLSEAGGVSEPDRAADVRLAESIANAGNVVLVEKLPEGGSQAIVPLPEFAAAAWAVGFADLPQEEANFVRSAQLFRVRPRGDGGFDQQLSFGAWLAQGFTGQVFDISPGSKSLQLAERTIPLRNDLNLQIDFRGRTPSFTRVSARDILCAEFKQTSAPDAACDPSKQPAGELFRDRIVIIGAANNDAPDLFGTPFYLPNPFPNRPLLRLFDREVPTVGKLMPGVEVHANVAATLLNGKHLARPAYPRQILFVLAPLVVVALGVFRLRAVWGLAVTLAVGVGILAFCAWAFETRGLILPLASAELATLGLLAPAGFLLRYAHERARREEQEAERAAIMDIFSRCVSPEVADTLWRQRGELALGGERRTVTLIFTDIRGFTSLSEGVDSEIVVTWLNEYFSRMHAVVCAHGGHINKFLGDGLMIVFGAPVARGDKLEARAAVSCGLEMLAEVERINRDWEGLGRPHIAIGVGIHTGEATCGVVGAEGRLEYTLIGDTVNLASRLESTTKEKGVPILISSTTAALLGVDYETRPLGDVKVKGKNQSTEVLTVRKAGRRQENAPVVETIGA